MLKRFFVNNFRSLLNTEFRPAGMNLLIGPNNAGKTNLCFALRLLSLSSEQTLDDALLNTIGERWNVTNRYASMAPSLDFEIECELPFRGELLHFSYALRLEVLRSDTRSEAFGADSLRVLSESLKATGGRFADTVLMEFNSGQARMLHEEGFAAHRSDSPYYVEALASTNATMLSQLYELENNPRAILFRRYLRSWAYYNFNPWFLRSPEVARVDSGLLSNGSNLSRAIYELHNQKPRLERKIIDAIRNFEPKFDLFSFSTPDPEHVHLFGEDEKGHRFSTRSMSDGTLRFLAIAYVILTSGQHAETTGLAPLILIEEPENGLYVGHLKPLLQRIEPDGSLGQFIFTTHSPYFIDLFDKSLEGINILRSGMPSTVLARPDVAKLNRMLQDMTLGELHFQDMLA